MIIINYRIIIGINIFPQMRIPEEVEAKPKEDKVEGGGGSRMNVLSAEFGLNILLRKV